MKGRKSAAHSKTNSSRRQNASIGQGYLSRAKLSLKRGEHSLEGLNSRLEQAESKKRKIREESVVTLGKNHE